MKYSKIKICNLQKYYNSKIYLVGEENSSLHKILYLVIKIMMKTLYTLDNNLILDMFKIGDYYKILNFKISIHFGL